MTFFSKLAGAEQPFLTCQCFYLVFFNFSLKDLVDLSLNSQTITGQEGLLCARYLQNLMNLTEKLKQLNQASQATVETIFLSCCGSRRWAQKMASARPFPDVASLLNQAEQIWQNLEVEDWLEAFAAHPKIGAKKGVPHQTEQSAEWSQGEQSGTRSATDFVRTELEESNRLYENKFGFIFIVCATGKSAEEMLEICRQRLNNDADMEIRIAADEQSKITEIRLKKR